jgi:hypothetical protein
MEVMENATLVNAGELGAQLDAIAQDAGKLVNGLDAQCGSWRATGDSWSVAQCLEHLAITNRAYLRPMQDAASDDRAQSKLKVWPALPGLMGRWFAKSLEPPARPPFKAKAPSAIQPSAAATVNEAFEDFMASHHQVEAFLRESACLNLNEVWFRSPFVQALRFSVASGIHIIAAHERRHLWQAWKIRRSAESVLTIPPGAPS